MKKKAANTGRAKRATNKPARRTPKPKPRARGRRKPIMRHSREG